MKGTEREGRKEKRRKEKKIKKREKKKRVHSSQVHHYNLNSRKKQRLHFVLFVCGEKLPFTSIIDIVKVHNSAIKVLSHFYDIRAGVQRN